MVSNDGRLRNSSEILTTQGGRNPQNTIRDNICVELPAPQPQICFKKGRTIIQTNEIFWGNTFGYNFRNRSSRPDLESHKRSQRFQTPENEKTICR